MCLALLAVQTGSCVGRGFGERAKPNRQWKAEHPLHRARLGLVGRQGDEEREAQ